MASYNRRFIAGFAKIAQPLHRLTAKGVQFHWSPESKAAFIALKRKLVTPPVLAYPRFSEEFVLETDALGLGLGAVLSQKQEDGKSHPIAYASRALNPAEKNCSVTDLETLAVVWSITHFHSYLYGGTMTVITDHSAVKSVLEASNPTGRHARWWTRVYGRGIKSLTIVYRAGRENASADALSRNPLGSPPAQGIGQGETQVSAVTASDNQETTPTGQDNLRYSAEQLKDSSLKEMVVYLEQDALPDDAETAKKLVAESSQFTLIDGVLYYVDHRRNNQRRTVVPQQLRETVLQHAHGGVYGGHFSGPKVYNTLEGKWWWKGMSNDVMSYCKRCPQCVIVSGGGRQHRPPLRPIPVERPFQKIGVDIMDLPCTERGNKHVVVFQDMFTKWPLVYPVPDQRAERIARLLCEEVIPMFGVPEALLSDRGSNPLSHLMDICRLLGIEKLNTTSYHPECDGMIERFNRTLKSMLRKRAAQFGTQWDNHLPGLLWAYRNTLHDTTGEKPSVLLFGWDCRSPLEAALIPVDNSTEPTNVEDYRQELVLTLSSARATALQTIRKAQERYKASYDHKADNYTYRVGDWVLICFPGDETGCLRKLSRPWHGPYHVTSHNETNLTAVKVYFPRESPIQVHQVRVKPCPQGFPAGFYWYGAKRQGPGRPPRWVEQVLANSESQTQDQTGEDTSVGTAGPEQSNDRH